MIFIVVFVAFIVSQQTASGCIPTYVNPESPFTPSPFTTTIVDPCSGCIPPPLREVTEVQLVCKPDESGTVKLSMMRNGDRCTLVPDGCEDGYLFVFEGQKKECSFNMKPDIIEMVECIDKVFVENVNMRKVEYVVMGCNTYKMDNK